MKIQPMGAEDRQANAGHSASQEVELLLAAWHRSPAAPPAAGLEARILERLQISSKVHAAAATRLSFYRAAIEPRWARTWALAPAAAALVCVAAGIGMVAHETTIATQVQRGQQTAFQQLPPAASIERLGKTPAVPAVQALTPAKSLVTAAARRRPVAPVPAGQRRGRASEGAASSSR